jgi:tight adherence protein C
VFNNIEFGFDLQTIIMIAAFIAAFASILAVALPFMQSDSFAARYKAVAARRQELTDVQRENFQQRKRLQPTRQEGWMRAVIDKLNMQDMLEAKQLKQKLQLAGLRRQTAAVHFIFWRVALPVIFLGIAAFYVYGVNKGLQLPIKAGILIGAAAFGWLMPPIWLTNIIQKRQKQLQRAFPDALDLMVICVESGMSIEAAFVKVSEEMMEGAPTMAQEMGLTAAELSLLGDRRKAYENMQERTGLAGFKSLSTMLLQSEKYGTPVAVGLRVIAQENREMRLMAAEKKAAALPAQLTVPMIVFFLPVLVLVIVGPAGIQVAAILK